MPALVPAILIAVVLTSFLSGIFGMAGGMVLMAILVLAMPVTLAMVIHGIAQGTSNGWRAWIHRDSIQWQPLAPYLIGAALTVTVFSLLQILPDANLVLIAVGGLPWLARIIPSTPLLTIEHRSGAFLCGVIVTIAQLLAGASGPILDMFYQRTELNRFQIVASKALTQTIGHLLKIGYYITASWSLVLRDSIEGARLEASNIISPAGIGYWPWWAIAAIIPAAMFGTQLGSLVLKKLSEQTFRRYTDRIILTLASISLLTGIVRATGVNTMFA